MRAAPGRWVARAVGRAGVSGRLGGWGLGGWLAGRLTGLGGWVGVAGLGGCGGVGGGC